jgi:hypothetical protein
MLANDSDRQLPEPEDLHLAASSEPGLMERLQNNLMSAAIIVAIGSGTTVFGITTVFAHVRTCARDSARRSGHK